MSLTVPLAGPQSPPKYPLPPATTHTHKCFQVFESSWEFKIGWHLRKPFSEKTKLLFTSPSWKTYAHVMSVEGHSSPTDTRQLPSITDFCVPLCRKDNIPLHAIFKREVTINVCHVKLRGFPDWQEAIAPAFGHHLSHLFSCPQTYGKGVWPTPMK